MKLRVGIGGQEEMARDDYLDRLKAVPLFAECSKRQLQEIGRVADELHLGAGEVLMRQGDVGLELFILLSGTAEVTRDGVHVNDVGPGHFLGEMAVLGAVPRNATVVATTDVEILVVTQRGLNQLLDDVPGLAKHLLYEVAKRLSSAGALDAANN